MKIVITDTPDKKALFFVFGLFAAIGLLAYANTFGASFHFDDFAHLVGNPALQNMFLLNRIWNYEPARFLPYWTFAVNRHLLKNSLPYYHLLNISIHILASFFVYRLASLACGILRDRKLAPGNGDELAALFAGLIFLTHPVQTQAVTYIIQRMAEMAALFVILTVFFYLKYRHESKSRYLAISCVSAFAALLCKENAYTFIGLLFLCELMFFCVSPKSLVRGFKNLALFLGVAAGAYFLIHYRILAAGNFSALPKVATNLPRTQYLFTQFNVLRTYIRLLFLPWGQNLDYDYPLSKSLLEPATFLSLLFLLSILAGAFLCLRKKRLLAFGIFWFFVAMSIESSIFSIRDVIYEHRMYLPMVGGAVVVSEIIRILFRGRKEFGYVSFGVVLIFAFLTYSRNSVWKNELTLWKDVIGKSPNKPRPYLQLGRNYMERHALEEAFENFNKALQLSPEDPEAFYNLGVAYMEKGNRERAAEFFLKTGDRSREYPQAFNNLGIIFEEKGDYDRALQYYRKALEINPDFGDVYYNAAGAYEKKGDLKSALVNYLEALSRDPSDPGGYHRVGITYGKLADYPNAIRYLGMGLRLAPSSVSMHKDFAVANFKAGNRDAVRAEIENLIRLGEGEWAEKLRAELNGAGLPPQPNVTTKLVTMKDGKVYKATTRIIRKAPPDEKAPPPH